MYVILSKIVSRPETTPSDHRGSPRKLAASTRGVRQPNSPLSARPYSTPLQANTYQQSPHEILGWNLRGSFKNHSKSEIFKSGRCTCFSGCYLGFSGCCLAKSGCLVFQLFQNLTGWNKTVLRGNLLETSGPKARSSQSFHGREDGVFEASVNQQSRMLSFIRENPK